MKDSQLEVKVIDGLMSISIGVETLKYACVILCDHGGGGEIKITDDTEFLEGFVNELLFEHEDGTTLIHHAFDKAVYRMLENGERGIDFVEDVNE